MVPSEPSALGILLGSQSSPATSPRPVSSAADPITEGMMEILRRIPFESAEASSSSSMKEKLLSFFEHSAQAFHSLLLHNKSGEEEALQISHWREATLQSRQELDVLKRAHKESINELLVEREAMMKTQAGMRIALARVSSKVSFVENSAADRVQGVEEWAVKEIDDREETISELQLAISRDKTFYAKELKRVDRAKEEAINELYSLRDDVDRLKKAAEKEAENRKKEVEDMRDDIIDEYLESSESIQRESQLMQSAADQIFASIKENHPEWDISFLTGAPPDGGSK